MPDNNPLNPLRQATGNYTPRTRAGRLEHLLVEVAAWLFIATAVATFIGLGQIVAPWKVWAAIAAVCLLGFVCIAAILASTAGDS